MKTYVPNKNFKYEIEEEKEVTNSRVKNE